MEKDELNMNDILNSIPTNVVNLKENSNNYIYSIKNCNRIFECFLHYIPALYISRQEFDKMIERNFGLLSKKDIPEFNLTDNQVLDIGEKRISRFISKNEGFVFDNPKIYRLGNLNRGYELIYNEKSTDKNRPQSIMKLQPFKASFNIEDYKDIKHDDAIASYLSKTLYNKYGEIYSKFYSSFYVNMFFCFAKQKNQVLLGHTQALQRKLKLIGKQLNNPEHVIKHGLYVFDYNKLENVPAKNYDINSEK